MCYSPADPHVVCANNPYLPKTGWRVAPNKGGGGGNVTKPVFPWKQVGSVREGERALDPAYRVPHGHGLPQSGQHLVPVGDPYPAGLRADDHMTQVLTPAVIRGLRHSHPQREFLQATHGGYTSQSGFLLSSFSVNRSSTLILKNETFQQLLD